VFFRRSGGPRVRSGSLALGLAGATLAWTVLGLAVAAWDWRDRWWTPGSEWRYFLRLWLFWASAAFPLAFGAVLAHAIAARRLSTRVLCLVAALPLAAGTWARLVEPELLRVRHTVVRGAPAQAQPVRIALVSDIHWGLYGRDHQLRRLVARLNELGVDAVFIAGDWTYEPRRDLAGGLAPLADLRMPSFAVLGNHDTEAPGPPLAAALRGALERNGVRVVEGRRLDWKGWEIVGLEDLWGGSPRRQARELLAGPHPARLVLAHQPDTFEMVPAGSSFIGLAGHTHGGQIQLPWLTGKLLRSTTRNPWWDGLYDTAGGRVFVTPGIGMIGLPMRLGVPPTIDVITLAR